MTAYLDKDTFRALTRVKQTRLGVAVGQPNAETLLQVELDRAAAYVEFVTGQPAMDSTQPPLPTNSGTLSPTALPTLLTQAIQMRTEQVTFQSQNSYLDDATDDVISSLSVGGFSQSKSDPARRGEQRQLNSWQALSNLLWLLMTPDRYDHWIVFLSGDISRMIGPAWGVEQSIHPSAGPAGGWGYGIADYAFFGYAGSGWQGWGGSLPGDILPIPTD